MTQTNDTPQINNPSAWFYADSPENEWWSGGHASRDEAISHARERYGDGRAIWVAEAKRMVPNLEGVILADNVIDSLQDDEAWGEDGWEGYGPEEELQRRLDECVAKWFAECCELTGANLDFVHGWEKVK